MRTIGNIERFLVIGIVVVIGAILAVAIKGADDLDGAYKKSALAKSSEGKKSGATALNRTDPARGAINPAGPAVPKSDHPESGSVGTDTAHLSDAAERLLNNRRPGDPSAQPGGTGEKQDPAKGTLATPGGETGGAGGRSETDSGAPVVIKDDVKVVPETGDVKGPAPLLPADRPIADQKQPSSTSLDWTYEVQPGDRLERVASTLYGEKSMWKEILAVNPSVSDATRIRVGMVLVLPKAPVNTTAAGLAHGTVKSAPAADGHHETTVADSTHSSQPADAAKSKSFKRVTSSERYEVQKGDTLMSIAAAQYGTRSAWKMILGANADTIVDKDHIKPGTILKLPAE